MAIACVAPDRIQFQHDFALSGKSLSTTENNDLIIEGWAASFAGIDRQNENFAPGAFARGVKAFLEGPATLAYHHDTKMVLGRVLDMKEIEGKGLWVKARVDGAIASHPVLGTIYSQIKNETLRSLSLGGFFRRAMTPNGPRIVHVDATELSITGVPALAVGTQFSVVGQKALESTYVEPDAWTVADELRLANLELGMKAAELTLALLGR